MKLFSNNIRWNQNKMKTSYFSFGQAHAHSVNNTTFDRDCIVKITAPVPRDVMTQHFGKQWAFEYDELPDMKYYPRGVFELAFMIHHVNAK